MGFKKVFTGTKDSGTDNHNLVTYTNQDNEIYINICVDPDDPMYNGWVCLDKETAIQLVKELKKSIGYLE